MPIIAAISVAIYLDSGRPIIYRQERIGYLGRPFDILKFRTMVRDAETAPVWASAQDPRRTRVGQFLRPTHLDELPQFWNVLSGAMSLVGPRPERSAFSTELRKIMPLYAIRSLVRPGITGWAQVRHGYASSTADSQLKLEHDLFYVKNRSLLLDLVIAIKTIGVVLRAGGY